MDLFHFYHSAVFLPSDGAICCRSFSSTMKIKIKKTPQQSRKSPLVNNPSQKTWQLMGSVSVSVLSLFLCAERAACFHIRAPLRYALLTVNHLTPAERPGGLLEEVITQKIVALQTLLEHLGLPVGRYFLFQATVTRTWNPGLWAIIENVVNDRRKRKDDLCFFSFCMFSLELYPSFLFFFFSGTVSSWPCRLFYFREALHNGISHWSIYQLNTDEITSLSLLSASLFSTLLSLSLCLCVLLLVWIDLTVLFQLSLQQQMSAILKLNLEPGLLGWARGYLTCLTHCLTLLRVFFFFF